MSNHKNLLFFNKEGDNLNFSYSDINDRFEGSIMFHENSNDTFKTAGIYTLERIPSFEFENPGEMYLNKFQLFNEFGFDFYAGKYVTQSITKIEPINNDPQFYSKWIYGVQFDIFFPIGTIIRFNSSFLEFTNPLQTYTVVSVKKGAIMIISSVDNATFETNYYNDYIFDDTYIGKSISSVNAIGIYNYINNSYQNNLSAWNEPNFYDLLYKRKKLNIINSEYNDKNVTVIEEEITDTKFFEYYTSNISSQDLIIEVASKTDLPKIYEGSLSLEYTAGTWSTPETNKLVFGGLVPEILKPGREFKIIGSNNNQNFFTVANIPNFYGNTQQTFYENKSQVLFNNRIYECIQAYTQSFALESTQFITPESEPSYWTNVISHIKVDQQVTPEFLSTCQLYLTTDKLYFSHGFTQSSQVTLASAAEKYSSDFKSFNIELFYEKGKLKADLMYPSKYVEVNFYEGSIGPTYSIGSFNQTHERLIQVSEPLTKELNYNFSSNHSVNIVFTDLDEYGFKLLVNKQVFEEEIVWVYSGASPDMERTIDRTLRAWLKRNYILLQKLGIVADLQYVGSFISPFYNSIKLHTEYPNVEMIVNDVKVGTTANYYIEHSRVLFNDMGSYLSFNINGETYDQNTIYLTGTYSQYPDIPSTLQSWVDEHSGYLATFGILVTNINNLLKFDVKRLDRRLDYTITTGKSNLPGINDYTITKKIKGNNGVIITSNEVRLTESASGTYSFEDAGFATGMAFSINNTFHTWNNTEFNVQFLDPEVMNLSYQGPFWGTKDPSCNSSAFITLAFEIGFGQTACDPIIGPTGSAGGGPFNTQQFSSAFSLTYNPNAYTTNTYNLQQYNGTNNLVDISYIQLSNSIYAFGDEVIVMDAFLTDYITNIPLVGNTQSKKMEFNPINNYLYCVSNQIIYAIDPLINTVVKSMTFSSIINDVKFNTSNGDMYVSFINSPTVRVYNSNNTLTTTLSSSTTNFPTGVVSTGKMAFNEFEGDMYIQTFGSLDQVIRVNTDKTIQTSYGIPGLTGSLFYEPVNESVYAYDTSNLWRIDNGLTVSISGIATSPFNDVIFNNLTGQMNISDTSTAFRGLDLITNNIGYTSYLGNYGYLALNQYDGSIYMSSKGNNAILVINPVDGTSLSINPMSAMTDKIIYNPERKSVWTIQPGLKSIIEVEVTLNSTITPEITPSIPVSEDNRYGTLDPNYAPHESIWLKTKEYLRKPRENFSNETRVEYYWKWLSDTSPEFFIYDFSGTQLTSSGSYSYTGPKPLPTVVLNKKPNKELTKVGEPEYQQTIFDEVHYPLSYIDDETNISTAPEPLELFLGFRADDEGAIRSILQLYKKEDVSLTIDSTSTNNTFITLETLDINGPDKRGLIKLNTNSSEYFTEKGLKEGQLIAIYIKDNVNKKKQYISDNNGTIVRIRNVFYKTLIVDFLEANDLIFSESTLISDYPSVGNKTYCRFDIKVIDREIGRFITYGQTEIEDVRFKTELGNVGKLIAPNEVFIFKDYDVLEGGIDWTYLNKKRKEMLMMKHLIYPYIGAYKSIINAINFFGYNDLQLNEYYRNINPQSEKFLKLFKQEIPDIFDNTVEGWTESDFITNNFPNDDYEETRMFNLTYNITDKEGNKIINYSIDEVIIKLQGLKYWLKRNIIPLTHKILDITGRSYFKNQTEIIHTSYDIQMINIKQNMTPISFKLNEAYLMPINSGSTVYNCVIDFYSIVDGIGADKNPTGLVTPPKPFNGMNLELPDYFDITIRTYKTYKEWAPFTTYNKGDKITYFGKIYESQIDGNKIKNPRKYENLIGWVSGASYSVTNTVEYNRDVFVYSGLGTMSATASSIIPPINDTNNWLKITEWKEINYEPVQNIKEFRKITKPDDTRVYSTGNNFNTILPFSTPVDINTNSSSSEKSNNSLNPILPFNFTIDSNLDPFIVIEVTSDNGYGLIYRDKKNYEIRGLKDLTEPTRYIDLIGPFQPITPVY